MGVFGAEGVDDHVGIINGEGGLGEVGDFVIHGYFEACDIFGGFHDADAVGRFAEGADDFVMVFVSDENDGVFFLGEADGFGVDFGDEGAGGINLEKVAFGGFVADFGRDAVSRIDDGAAGGDFLDGIHKDDALGDETVNNMLVMHDFMIDVDRRAFELEDAVNAFDGHVDAGAKASGIGEEDFHGHGGSLSGKHDATVSKEGWQIPCKLSQYRRVF